jgi:hypothetical protein
VPEHDLIPITEGSFDEPLINESITVIKPRNPMFLNISTVLSSLNGLTFDS